MSSRRKPRNPELGPTWRTGLRVGNTLAVAEYLARTTSCPDCDSMATVNRLSRVVNVLVAHDDGCPYSSGVTRWPRTTPKPSHPHPKPAQTPTKKG